MREIYVNEIANSVRDIPLTMIGGIEMVAVWKQRKDIWYVEKTWSEKNAIEALTQCQFHEALQNGNR
jgi:hypothetical protein